MPSLASLFFFKQHQQQQQQHACDCVCHEDTSITRPTSWIERIRRRSSSSSSSSQSYYDNSSLESMQDLEDKKINEFITLYELAVDEIRYAVEFQGSIYYSSDLREANEAVTNCLESFQCLLQALPSKKASNFKQKWSTLLMNLKSNIDSLPVV